MSVSVVASPRNQIKPLKDKLFQGLFCMRNLTPKTRPGIKSESKSNGSGRRAESTGFAGTVDCGDTQHPIPAKWKPRRERRSYRSAVAGFAGIVGCGGSQHPILAIGRARASEAGGLAVKVIPVRIPPRPPRRNRRSKPSVRRQAKERFKLDETARLV